MIDGIPWNSVEFYSENSAKFHGISRHFGACKQFRGILRNFESQQSSMEFHGTFVYVAQVSWKSVEPHCSSMEFYVTTRIEFWKT